MDQFLFISELEHFLLTLGIALLFFWRFHDRRVILFCFFFGFLIDVDHLFDYFAYHGFNFNLARFLDVHNYMGPAGKIYVLFHGWEYLLLFWLLGRWLGKRWKIKKLEWAISLVYLGHLLIDHLSFSHHPLVYFFFYRLLNNFSLESFRAL